MATADAVVHLQSDFYEHAVQAMQGKKTDEQIRKWAQPKIERDFHDKILFEKVQSEVEPDYERLKAFFAGELNEAHRELQSGLRPR